MYRITETCLKTAFCQRELQLMEVKFKTCSGHESDSGSLGVSRCVQMMIICQKLNAPQ